MINPTNNESDGGNDGNIHNDSLATDGFTSHDAKTPVLEDNGGAYQEDVDRTT